MSAFIFIIAKISTVIHLLFEHEFSNASDLMNSVFIFHQDSGWGRGNL